MEIIKINWDGKLYNFEDMSKLSNSNDGFLDEKGFYHIFAGKYHYGKKKEIYTDVEKLYIGMAYDQTLRTRVPQDHTAYKKINKYLNDHPDSYVMIRVGVITESTSNKITKGLYLDIENALIYKNKPLFNEQGKESYNGRDIEIQNIGKYGTLEEVIHYKND